MASKLLFCVVRVVLATSPSLPQLSPPDPIDKEDYEEPGDRTAYDPRDVEPVFLAIPRSAVSRRDRGRYDDIPWAGRLHEWKPVGLACISSRDDGRTSAGWVLSLSGILFVRTTIVPAVSTVLAVGVFGNGSCKWRRGG